MINYLHVKEGLRIFKRAKRVKKHGIKKYSGTPVQICEKILKNCYNKEKNFFQVSAGHFNQFYARDFGMIIESLLNLGYKKEVHKTLQYALSCYSRGYKISTQITPDEKLLDTFDMSSDSLPFILHSLNVSKSTDLVQVYKEFLQNEIYKYIEKIVDQKTGLVKRNAYFSSMKDKYIRDSSCYDNCMVAFLANEAKKAKLSTTLNKFNYEELIKKHFWNGRYFKDSMSDSEISTDANTFPYWCSIIKDKKMMKSSIEQIKKHRLDIPLCSKYKNERVKKQEISIMSKLVPNYEGTTLWVHLGICYIKVVSSVDKKLLKSYLNTYTKAIKKYKNFLEVYNEDLTPYQSKFYYSDESMSWCAVYLDLIKD